MRVLIVGPSTTRSKGGMATVITSQLNNSWLNSHHKLTYLVSHVEGNLAEKAWYSLKSILYILWYHRRFDVVHFHSAADASFYRKSILLRLSSLLNIKTVFHIHGSDFDSFYTNRNGLLKRYISTSLAKSNKVLVLSNYWELFFKKEFKSVSPGILKNGIDVSSFRQAIKQSAQYSNFLFLGRLGERKGTYDLLKAIDLLVNTHHRKNLIFYFAGDGDIEQVNKIIKEKKLGSNVKVLGWLNNTEKLDLLKGMDVVILPSYDENLPMALIEAMACGKVIISTYAGGIPDLVTPQVNGFLFNAGDVTTLVNHIIYVSEHPDMMRHISANNIEKIKNDFNLDKLSRQLHAIYQSL